MAKILSKFILKLLGWKFAGEFPYYLKKYVLIVVPHTANSDFAIGILARSALGADIKYLGKSSLFKPPHGFLFRWWGGYPVDRSKKQNYVQAVVDIFNGKEVFAIAIAPEGTRKRVEKLKTGFYYIALGAKVPILMVQFDYGNKIIRFSEPFYPSGKVEEDFEVINNYFRSIKGKYPERSYL